MANRSKLTNSSDETSIGSLLSGDCIYSIPYFQRPYKWKPPKLKQLESNILEIIDASDSHFLGAIIIHGRRSNPTDPNPFEIIDGQQRITTLILYLCATVRTLCQAKEYEEAASLFLKYLVIGRETRLHSNLKLHPCKEDRAQLNHVYTQLLAEKDFAKALGNFKPKMYPSTGRNTGVLRNNFNQAVRFLKQQYESEGTERITEIYTAILDSTSVVQIDVWDPTNGPKIFDGLNSHQEPMTIGDLVRNEIFSKVSTQDIDYIDHVDEHKWQPFYKGFQQDDKKNLFDSYFFPFGLIQDPNLRKSEVYGALRESWATIDEPEDIIDSLSEYQNAFIDIVCGTNSQELEKKVAERFHNLWLSKLPSSTYPFLMQVSNAVKNNELSSDIATAILDRVESFLVRRAICGHEPTGLHAVFKRLWSDCKDDLSANRVESAIRKHKTVSWPDDSELEKAIHTRPLYGSSITGYILMQYDISMKGDPPYSTTPWIEHVLPEKLSPEWAASFGEEDHARLKDTLANLIPLSDEMNRSLGNKAYSEKCERYLKDSAYKSAREFARKYKSWTPVELESRANVLAKWAISRWK